MNHLRNLDYVVFFIYFILVAGYGYWVYRRKMYHQKNAGEMDSKIFSWRRVLNLVGHRRFTDRFQYFCGTFYRHVGFGFRIRTRYFSYEWMAAATLIIVAVFLHTHLSQEQDLHNAAVPSEAV
jgi:SSS family solute:Na+ symporter